MDEVLYLRFLVVEGGGTRLIISPALLNAAGLYEDVYFVYTEEGKFRKKDIVGEIDAFWEPASG